MLHKNFIVILVEPQGPINIGSACRIIMNFGFNNLRLVNPCRDYKSEQARKMALTAQDMLNNAQIFDNLSDALFDCNTAFGTTRRFGKYRKNFFTPQPAGKAIADINNNMRCALVLGREDNGLTTDELSLCQYFITIPTNDSFPSMNLSHALGILLYEIDKFLSNYNTAEFTNRESITNLQKIGIESDLKDIPHYQKSILKSPAEIKSLEQMFNHIKKALCGIEFLDSQNPEHILRSFRHIFGRAGLTERDVRIIRGLMSKIEWVNSQRKQS